MQPAVYTTASSIPAVTWRCVDDSQTRNGPGEYSWCVTATCAEVRTFRQCYNAAFRTLR